MDDTIINRHFLPFYLILNNSTEVHYFTLIRTIRRLQSLIKFLPISADSIQLQLKPTRQLFVIFVPWRRYMRCFDVNFRDLSQIRVTLLTNIATLLLEECCLITEPVK